MKKKSLKEIDKQYFDDKMLRIIELYKTENATLKAICESEAVTRQFFLKRIKQDPALLEIYARTKIERKEKEKKELVYLAKTALQRKLNFEKILEKRQIFNSEGVLLKTIHQERAVVPTSNDIALVLTRMDKDFMDLEDSSRPNVVEFRFEVVQDKYKDAIEVDQVEIEE